jgi:hypothetical protein
VARDGKKEIGNSWTDSETLELHGFEHVPGAAVRDMEEKGQFGVRPLSESCPLEKSDLLVILSHLPNLPFSSLRRVSFPRIGAWSAFQPWEAQAREQ